MTRWKTGKAMGRENGTRKGKERKKGRARGMVKRIETLLRLLTATGTRIAIGKTKKNGKWTWRWSGRKRETWKRKERLYCCAMETERRFGTLTPI